MFNREYDMFNREYELKLKTDESIIQNDLNFPGYVVIVTEQPLFENENLLKISAVKVYENEYNRLIIDSIVFEGFFIAGCYPRDEINFDELDFEWYPTINTEYQLKSFYKFIDESLILSFNKQRDMEIINRFLEKENQNKIPESNFECLWTLTKELDLFKNIDNLTIETVSEKLKITLLPEEMRDDLYFPKLHAKIFIKIKELTKVRMRSLPYKEIWLNK